MACLSCGSAGSCSCVNTTIPIGPAGPTGPTGLQGIQGPQGSQGIQGIQGLQGVQNKYCVTMQVSGSAITGVPYFIAQSAITNSGTKPLTTTWTSNPLNVDFNITIWKSANNNDSTVWTLIQPTDIISSYVNGIGLTITAYISSYIRIVIQ